EKSKVLADSTGRKGHPEILTSSSLANQQFNAAEKIGVLLVSICLFFERFHERAVLDRNTFWHAWKRWFWTKKRRNL
ncbi:AAEL001786-PA, partial [Aedes aegypti]